MLFLFVIVLATHTDSSRFLLNFTNSYTFALFLICSHQFLFVCSSENSNSSLTERFKVFL